MKMPKITLTIKEIFIYNLFVTYDLVQWLLIATMKQFLDTIEQVVIYAANNK